MPGKFGFKVIIFPLLMALAINTYAQKKTFTVEQTTELRRLKKAVESNPNNLKDNQDFIFAWGRIDSLLLMQYNYWLKKFPTSSAIPLAIGLRLGEDPQAAKYLQRAVAINPNLSDAWVRLSGDAMMKGDQIAAIGYLKKAESADPANSELVFQYAVSFEQIDTAVYHSLLMDFSKRFPKNPLGIVALFDIANDQKNNGQKIAYYKLIQEKYDKVRGNTYLYAMNKYYSLLLFESPLKALEIAQDTKNPVLTQIADTVIKVKKLLSEQKASEADSLIKNVQLPDLGIDKDLLLFKAGVADSANNPKAAYDSILHYYVKNPDESVQKALFYYGAKIGINTSQVDSEIKQLRDSNSRQATDFSLYNYLNKQNNSLAEYRGRVILLTYWFPGCGPCRAEFPHFEKVLQRFNKNEVVYLGINLVQSQDSYVLPLITSNHYTFIPLRDVPNREYGNLKANGAPTNYLIDQEGRVIFSDFQIDGNNEDTLELMIRYLLNSHTTMDRLLDTVKNN